MTPQTIRATQAWRLAFITSTYYPGYKEMLDAAMNEAERYEATVVLVSEVPSYSAMPLPVKIILERQDVDAVVVIPGSLREKITDNTIVCLEQLSLQYNKPVIKDLMGPRIKVGPTKSRAEHYARAGVKTAVLAVREIARLRDFT